MTTGVKASPMSRQKIKEIASKVRELSGLNERAYFPIVEFIEFVMGDPENGFTYEIVSEKEMRQEYALTNTALDVMKIRQDVYDRAARGNPRDRFTLCHELGHYLLHHPGSVSHARGEIETFCDPEWQANTFAGELMAPAHLIRNMTVEQIMENCGLSWTAANIQYNECRKNCYV